MEHVYEKIINLDNESQTTSSSNNEKAGEQEKEEDIAVLAEEKIELLCQDQVSSLGGLAKTQCLAINRLWISEYGAWNML